MEPTYNQGLDLLSRTLAAHNVDGSLAVFTAEEMQAIIVGGYDALDRMGVLNEVVVDFVAGAQRLALPERAAHLDEQARILDHWAAPWRRSMQLPRLSAGIGLDCDELEARSDPSETPARDQALSAALLGRARSHL